VPTDDEIRRVAEDLRALAKSLARDIREAVDEARRDPRGVGRATRDDFRQVRSELRNWQRRDRWSGERWPGGCHPGQGPRWDNWGRTRPGARTIIPETGPGQSPDGADDAELAGQQPAQAPAKTAWPPVAADRRPTARQRPRPPVRHRHDGSALLGLLAVVFGLAWLAAGTHVLQLSAEAVLAVALMIVGVTTVLTARTDWALSRRSWPVLLGAGLVFALILASASPRFPGGFRDMRVGSRTLMYSSWAELPPTINGSVGRTVVDLTSLSPPLPATQAVHIGGIGLIVVRLPPGVHVVIDAHVGAGSINLSGEQVANGLSSTTHRELNPLAAGPALELDINSGVGSVQVEQPSSAVFPNPTPPPNPMTPPTPTTPPNPASSATTTA
jgi:hypothetical protein